MPSGNLDQMVESANLSSVLLPQALQHLLLFE